jgi:hypothetical protein
MPLAQPENNNASALTLSTAIGNLFLDRQNRGIVTDVATPH